MSRLKETLLEIEQNGVSIFESCPCGSNRCKFVKLIRTRFILTPQLKWGQLDSENRYCDVVTFEKVVDSAPEDIQTILIFHLDLFT